jgi:phage terminase large subunit-like protein
MDWQERIIRDLFGIVRKYDECRQFRRAFVSMPKKNGKSELAAAIALILTCIDMEYGGEIYGCATDRQQASIVFDVAENMVNQLPELKKHIKLNVQQKRMTFKPLNSFYQVLSSEAFSKDGLNAHGVIFDELHAQKNRNFFDIITSGSGLAREQPLTFIITTAGFDRNSICWEQYQKAQDILAGRKFDPTFYPVIYSADESENWMDEEVWRKANPSLGITIDPHGFRVEFEDARVNETNENKFRRLNLNQWVRQETRWMPMEYYDKCAFPVDIEKLKGRKCYGGLDLSKSRDITAFVLCFPPENPDDPEDKFYLLPFFWIPEASVRRRVDKDHVPYDQWIAKGLLHTTEGNVINYGFVQKKIEELYEIYNIQAIAYDRWGAEMLRQRLEDAGFTMTEFGQGYRDISPASKETLRLVLEGQIAHGGNPVLRWNFENIVVKTDEADNIKPDKKKATERIDGAVAAIMSIGTAIKRTKKKPSGGAVIINTRDNTYTDRKSVV